MPGRLWTSVNVVLSTHRLWNAKANAHWHTSEFKPVRESPRDPI